MTKYERRPAAARSVTRTGWRETWHSFSFGDHYDPANTHFGPLLANNDDTLLPGSGYDTHQHRDTEIVTWVLDGALAHEDSNDRRHIVRPGFVARLSAGSGIEHSERNAGPMTVRFIQMWLQPSVEGTEPGYLLRDVAEELRTGQLVPVLEVGQAVLHAARLAAGAAGELPVGLYVHAYVARGGVRLAGVGELGEGDALRVTDCDGARLVATEGGAEVLVWVVPQGQGAASRVAL